jgi:hypothetical protein
MPARNIRYVRNAPAEGFGTFGDLMMSDQIQDVADAGARDIAAIATQAQRLSTQPYTAEVHQPIVIDGNPRRTAQVVGNDRLHAVEEFGSGTTSEGATTGQPRPQGGHSPARRTLAKAAAEIVPPAEVKPA